MRVLQRRGERDGVGPVAGGAGCGDPWPEPVIHQTEFSKNSVQENSELSCPFSFQENGDDLKMDGPLQAIAVFRTP
ncbi:hypothetical protein [Roseovarius sp. A-2]|uniref:hypothetical protein n=1 Tax=Roseovarius sp. A-2 TaxID=1570360 RepID=UPI001117E862|nr:hypothetical protein [Roseovarius sp. A-2]